MWAWHVPSLRFGGLENPPSVIPYFVSFVPFVVPASLRAWREFALKTEYEKKLSGPIENP